MLHSVSRGLTEWFYRHRWIDESDYAWCMYAVEKKLLQICFLFILAACLIVSKQYLNATIYMATLYLLRCRIGGRHAPYNWLCILLTTGTTLAVLYVLAPLLMSAVSASVWALDILLIGAALMTDPVYPPQLHFDEDVSAANRRKKEFCSRLYFDGADYSGYLWGDARFDF